MEEFKTNFKEGKKKTRSESNFSEEDKSYFDYNYACWECGMNRWDCFHHILKCEFIEAKSIFNAAPLHNTKCHIGKGHHFTTEQENTYLQKTMNYLYQNGYVLKEVDRIFISKNKDKYKQIPYEV